MLRLDFEDYIIITFKSLLLSLILAPFIIGLVYLIDMNINFSNIICNISGIPKDLALTVMSPGFGNEIIILTTTFEFCIIFYVINKFVKTKLFNTIYEFVCYL